MKTTKEYSSPLRKLVVFFERSRDQWKQKCRDAKELVRSLSGRVRSLERSRDQWKQRAKQLQLQLQLTEQKAKHRPAQRGERGVA